MELSPLAFAIFLGVPVLLGSAILRALGIGPRTDPLAYPGWVWLSGALAVAALETLRLLAGLEGLALQLGLALLAAAGLHLYARRVPQRAPEPGASESAGRLPRVLFHAALALALAVMADRITSSSLALVHENDEANFWALRAKLLFDDGGFGEGYVRAMTDGSLKNASYPLLNSLLQLWTFDCAGGITHVVNRLPVQLGMVALVLCAASAFRRLGGPGVAAGLLVLLASTGPMKILSRQAFSDGLVSLGALVAVDAATRGEGLRARAWLGLASLGVTFLLWSKREGSFLLLGALAALALWRWRAGGPWRPRLSRGAWLAGLAPLLVVLGTQLHNAVFPVRGSHAIAPGFLAPLWKQREELPQVLSFLLEVGTSAAFHAIPAAFVLLFLLARPRRLAPGLALLPLAALFFTLALVVALVQGNTEYLLRTAGERVLAQLLPLLLLWIAAVAPQLRSATLQRGPGTGGLQPAAPPPRAPR